MNCLNSVMWHAFCWISSKLVYFCCKFMASSVVHSHYLCPEIMSKMYFKNLYLKLFLKQNIWVKTSSVLFTRLLFLGAFVVCSFQFHLHFHTVCGCCFSLTLLLCSFYTHCLSYFEVLFIKMCCQLFCVLRCTQVFVLPTNHNVQKQLVILWLATVL